MEHTRSITYTAKYPKDILEEKRVAFNSEINEVSNQLSEVYDKLIDSEIPKVWLLRGMNNITAKTINMIRRAKRDITLLGALYSENEIEQLKEELSYATKKGLHVRVISRQSIKLNDGELDIIKNLSSVIPKISKTGGPKFQNL